MLLCLAIQFSLIELLNNLVQVEPNLTWYSEGLCMPYIRRLFGCLDFEPMVLMIITNK